MATKEQLISDINQAVQAYCDQEFSFQFDPNNPTVRLHEPTFGAEEINAAIGPMLSTFVTMGKEVRKFEEQYAGTMGHGYGVMNNSGSSANLLAIAALTNPATSNPLQAGDEVIVPSLSWSTTVWPLIQHSLIPVFVDCDPRTFNLDLEKLEAAITDKTKAIMLVHVYGNPCDMDGIMSLAQKYNLQVIEDSCESMGAYYNDKAVGSFGRMGTFSFYFSHHITTLEGGITVTDEFELAETMRILRAHGWSREADEHQKYTEQHPDINPRFIFVNQGYNLRPTECQGAMGQIQLPKLAGLVERRRHNVEYYRKSLEKYSEYFEFQDETEKGYSSWFGFAIIVKENAPFTVDDITDHLHNNHIETRPIIAGNIARHPVMQLYNHRIGGDLSASDRIMQRGFALGCHQHICDQAIDYIVGNIDAFMNNQELASAA